MELTKEDHVFEVQLNMVWYDEIILNIISQRHIKQWWCVHWIEGSYWKNDCWRNDNQEANINSFAKIDGKTTIIWKRGVRKTYCLIGASFGQDNQEIG